MDDEAVTIVDVANIISEFLRGYRWPALGLSNSPNGYVPPIWDENDLSTTPWRYCRNVLTFLQVDKSFFLFGSFSFLH